jgi:hypothetical protein
MLLQHVSPRVQCKCRGRNTGDEEWGELTGTTCALETGKWTDWTVEVERSGEAVNIFHAQGNSLTGGLQSGWRSVVVVSRA